MANYHEITCGSALNKLKRKMPYPWDLNIYRGCEHGCKYCFAIYSHDYLNISNKEYFQDIYVKTNILEHLEKELAERKWKREVVNIGGVTDSYQPLEKKYKLMPEVLKLLIKYQTPCIISTKSDLILRDYELIEELASITYVNVAATITCMDIEKQKKLEPNGVLSEKRFEMLKEFSKTNASRGLHVMPIVPYLTDDYDNINKLFYFAKDSKVSYVLPGALYLRGKTREVFFDFIRKEYYELYEPLKSLFQSGASRKEYKDGLYKMVNQVIEKYKLSGNYSSVQKEKLNQMEDKQMTIFNFI